MSNLRCFSFSDPVVLTVNSSIPVYRSQAWSAPDRQPKVPRSSTNSTRRPGQEGPDWQPPADDAYCASAAHGGGTGSVEGIPVM